MTGDWDGRVQRFGREAFAGRTNERAQLRSATLLRVIRDDDTPMPAFTFDARELAGAAQLARIGELNRTPRERRRDPDMLRAIAEVFEDLAAGLEPGSPQRIPWLTTAAATWSLAGYQANSVVLAKALINELDTARLGYAEDDPSPLGEANAAMAAVIDGVARIVAAVLVRDVNAVAHLGRRATTDLPGLGSTMISADNADGGITDSSGDSQGDTDDDDIERIEPVDSPASLSNLGVLGAYGLLGRAATALARFWIAGDRQAATVATTSLDRASKTLLDVGVVDIFNLVDNLAHVVEDIVAVAPWRRLRDNDRWGDHWRRYLTTRALDERPLLQVWPSQQAAIDTALLRAPRANLLITMPTSAGKTNIAEWAILDAVGSATDKCAVYIVPTRALATEAEATLSRSLSRLGLTVSAMFGGLEHVDHELDLLSDSDVVVATAEKLDLLMRNSPEFPDRIALVIVDEGHLIGAGERGLRLELMLTRLRRRAPSARLLIISAVVPNSDGLGAWLEPGNPAQAVSDSPWSPSRLRIGVFGWLGAAREGQSGTVRYRPDDADPNFFVPRVLTQTIPKGGKNPFPADNKDIAAALVLHYQRLGPVLVGSTTRPYVESVANALVVAHRRRSGIWKLADFAQSVEDHASEERHELADLVNEVAGTGHPLRQMVLLGIAYHHAGLPDRLRKAFEKAYREGVLDVLVATSTLSQGINLPARTVIVSHTTRGKNAVLSARDFWNLAGRAGRAFGETEGHVVLVAKNAAEQTKLENRYRSRDNIEPVNSQLAVLFATLVRNRIPSLGQFAQIPITLDITDDDAGDLLELREVLDDQILATVAEEVVDTADQAQIDAALAKFALDTFGARQIGATEFAVPAFARYVTGRGRRVLSSVPVEARRVFMRTGLRVADNLAALAAVDAMLADPTDELALISRIIHDATELPTLARYCQKQDVAPALIEALAREWIAGQAVDILRQAHTAAVGGDPMRFLTVLDSLVCRDLPWAVSSLLILIEYRSPDFIVTRPTLATLTSMLKFGVPTPGACFASSMGVAVREDAIGVGALFAESGGDNYHLFRIWLETVERKDLVDASSIEAADRLLLRVGRRRAAAPVLDTIGRGDSGTTLLVIVDPVDEFNALSNPVGSPVALRHESTPERSDRVVVYDASNRPCGRLRFNDARTIAPLLTTGLLNGSATVAAVRMRTDGSVALRISIDLAELNPH